MISLNPCLMWGLRLEPEQAAVFRGRYSRKEKGQVGAAEYRQGFQNPPGGFEPVMEIERMV
jgi:hypothetical protein